MDSEFNELFFVKAKNSTGRETLTEVVGREFSEILNTPIHLQKKHLRAQCMAFGIPPDIVEDYIEKIETEMEEEATSNES